MFGLPTEDDGSRNDPLVGQNIVSGNAYQHDFDALRSVSARIVVGVGANPFHGGVAWWPAPFVARLWGRGDNPLPLVLYS